MALAMDFPHAQIISELENCGAAFDEIPQVEHAAYLQSWQQAYQNFYGENRRPIRGARAIEAASQLNDGTFMVIPCRDPLLKRWSVIGVAYRCRSQRLPDLTEPATT
jgi:hypothetical protein